MRGEMREGRIGTRARGRRGRTSDGGKRGIREGGLGSSPLNPPQCTLIHSPAELAAIRYMPHSPAHVLALVPGQAVHNACGHRAVGGNVVDEGRDGLRPAVLVHTVQLLHDAQMQVLAEKGGLGLCREV